ncbi:hypothetical protein ACJJTC_002586 [Scirpophaga incertulas]
MTPFLKMLSTLCSLFLIVPPSAPGYLPSPVKYTWMGKGGSVVDYRYWTPLKINNKIQRSIKRENMLLRKFKDSEETRLKRYDKDIPSNQFDRNGMIYLSEPKDKDDRSLNALLNKLIQYKTEHVGYLRHNTRNMFTDKDEYGDDGNDDNQSPAVVFELADLVN